MPFITLTGGLTLKVPTRGTTDWDTEFLNNFATPISNHQHTGSGDGAPLGGGSLQDDSLDDRKVRLRTDKYLRSRNNAGDGDIDIIKSNSDDELELADEVIVPGLKSKINFGFLNNQATPANVTGVLADPASDIQLVMEYGIKREGTADLMEGGVLKAVYNGTDFDLIQRYSGQDSGVTFTMTAGGQLQYTSSDNAGSTDETMHFTTVRIGA
jgi:hypothetical protein